MASSSGQLLLLLYLLRYAGNTATSRWMGSSTCVTVIFPLFQTGVGLFMPISAVDTLCAALLLDFLMVCDLRRGVASSSEAIKRLVFFVVLVPQRRPPFALLRRIVLTTFRARPRGDRNSGKPDFPAIAYALYSFGFCSWVSRIAVHWWACVLTFGQSMAPVEWFGFIKAIALKRNVSRGVVGGGESKSWPS